MVSEHLSLHKCLFGLVFIGSTLLLASCGPTFPTGDDIAQSLEEGLRSVQGTWSGIPVMGPVRNTVTFQFSFTEQPNGQLQGSGTMKELDQQLGLNLLAICAPIVGRGAAVA